MLRHKNRELIFIAEGGLKIGLGHLMRCIAVAERVRDLKIKPFFIVNTDKLVSDILKKYSFDFKSISDINNISIRYFNGNNIIGVLIDSKKNLSHLINRCKKNGYKVTLVDNITQARLLSDNVIYPFAHFDPKTLDWGRAKGKVYYGAKYFPLDEGFLRYRDSHKDETNICNLLVTFGGWDPNKLTLKVLEALKNCQDKIKVTVAIGPFFSYLKELEQIKPKLDRRFIFVKDRNMAELMSKANIAITAFGVTLYELAFMGVPAIIINNFIYDQKEAKNFGKLGTSVSLGFHQEVNVAKIIGAVEFLKDYKIRKKMSKKGMVLVDGLGARRISTKILELLNPSNKVNYI